MWIIIATISCFVAGKFLYDRQQQNVRIAREGGMLTKYRELIELLLSGHPQSTIYQQAADSITLGASGSGGTTLFILTQTTGNISIQWKVTSPLFGTHRLEWDFHEGGDQKKMCDWIMDDLVKYQSHVMVSHGYPEIELE